MNDDCCCDEWWRDSSHASLMSIIIDESDDEYENEDEDNHDDYQFNDQVRASLSGETGEIEIITRRWSYCFIGILGEQITDALACFNGKKTI